MSRYMSRCMLHGTHVAAQLVCTLPRPSRGFPNPAGPIHPVCMCVDAGCCSCLYHMGQCGEYGPDPENPQWRLYLPQMAEFCGYHFFLLSVDNLLAAVFAMGGSVVRWQCCFETAVACLQCGPDCSHRLWSHNLHVRSLELKG